MWQAALLSGENGKLIRRVVIGIIILIFVVIMYFVIKGSIDKAKKNKRNSQAISQIESEIKPEKLTFSDSEYENMAKTIDNAIGFWTDDEEAIYQVFMKLRTNSDLLKLQTVFGTRSSGHELFEAIHRNLSNSEIQKINSILAERNISITV